MRSRPSPIWPCPPPRHLILKLCQPTVFLTTELPVLFSLAGLPDPSFLAPRVLLWDSDQVSPPPQRLPTPSSASVHPSHPSIFMLNQAASKSPICPSVPPIGLEIIRWTPGLRSGIQTESCFIWPAPLGPTWCFSSFFFLHSLPKIKTQEISHENPDFWFLSTNWRSSNMSALLHPRGSWPLWIEYGFSMSPQSPPCPVVSALKPHIRAICHNSCNIVFSYSGLKEKIKYLFYPVSFSHLAHLLHLHH